MIELFNKYHLIMFGSIFGAFVLFTIALLCLRKFKKTTYTIILLTLLTCFVLHFLRVFMPNNKESFRTAVSFVAPATVCAVSAIIFPFVFMSRSKFWKDYMFFVGPITAIIAMVVPIAQYDTKAMEFDTFRFFITHCIIALMPIAMVICGHHKIHWHRFWVAVPGLILVGAVIITNDIILIATGVLDEEIAKFGGDAMGYLLSPEVRNTIMFYGPNPVVGGGMEKICKLVTPEFMRVNPFTKEVMYWPLVWMIIPFCAFVLPLLLVFAIICDPIGFVRVFKKKGKKGEKVAKSDSIKPRSDGKLYKLKVHADGENTSLDDLNI